MMPPPVQLLLLPWAWWAHFWAAVFGSPKP